LTDVPLKLRRPRDFRATPGNPDDLDVFDGERRVGRIFRSSSAPQDRPLHHRPAAQQDFAAAGSIPTPREDQMKEFMELTRDLNKLLESGDVTRAGELLQPLLILLVPFAMVWLCVKKQV
jgi:hypothetical protein